VIPLNILASDETVHVGLRSQEPLACRLQVGRDCLSYFEHGQIEALRGNATPRSRRCAACLAWSPARLPPLIADRVHLSRCRKGTLTDQGNRQRNQNLLSRLRLIGCQRRPHIRLGNPNCRAIREGVIPALKCCTNGIHLRARVTCPLLTTRKRPNRRITTIGVDCVVEIGSADKSGHRNWVINSDLRSFAPIVWN
jgi:hypothetical protein